MAGSRARHPARRRRAGAAVRSGFGIVLPVPVGFLEVLDAFPDAPPDFRQPVCSEDQDDDQRSGEHPGFRPIQLGRQPGRSLRRRDRPGREPGHRPGAGRLHRPRGGASAEALGLRRGRFRALGGARHRPQLQHGWEAAAARHRRGEDVPRRAQAPRSVDDRRDRIRDRGAGAAVGGSAGAAARLVGADATRLPSAAGAPRCSPSSRR